MLVNHSLSKMPWYVYDPTIVRSARRTASEHWRTRSSKSLYSTTLAPRGCSISRCAAYHGESRSANKTEWPRRASAFTSPRYVVAWPFPQDEVIERPKMTMLSGLCNLKSSSAHQQFLELSCS